MHLKLDHLITKNLNGVVLQIYSVLIAYLILQLIEIPAFYGNKLLEKLRFIQIFLHRHCSIIHWSYDLFRRNSHSTLMLSFVYLFNTSGINYILISH